MPGLLWSCITWAPRWVTKHSAEQQHYLSARCLACVSSEACKGIAQQHVALRTKLELRRIVSGLTDVVLFHPQAGIIVLKYLDMITVAVPPALAATLAVATAAAVSRLAKTGIFVSSSQHINFAGLVDFVAFDKTGTLTQSGLEFVGVAEAVGGKFTAAGLQADMGDLTEQHVQVCAAYNISSNHLSRAGIGACGATKLDPLMAKHLAYLRHTYCNLSLAATGVQLHILM